MKDNIIESAKQSLSLNDELYTLLASNQGRLFFNKQYRELYILELRRCIDLRLLELHLAGESEYDHFLANQHKFDIFLSDVFIQRLEENKDIKIYTVDDIKTITSLSDKYNEKLFDIIKKSRFCRYITELENMISVGRCYEELSEVFPGNFGLPQAWKIDELRFDKAKSISLVIAFTYDLVSTRRQPLRIIAKKLNTGYDVLINAEELAHEIQKTW